VKSLTYSTSSATSLPVLATLVLSESGTITPASQGGQ
jgi:hypothetical protein